MRFAAAGPWALEQFGSVELGDRRLTRRLVDYAARAAAGPSLSIPRQCGCWKRTKLGSKEHRYYLYRKHQ